MESSKILQSDVLDIIFDQKNKIYGAYELRKNYHKRARKALMIVAIFAIVASAVPLIAGLLIHDDRVIRRMPPPIHVIPNLPPVSPPVTPHDPPPNPHNPAKFTNHTDAPPVIVTADSVADRDLFSNEKPDAPAIAGPEGSAGTENEGALVAGPPKKFADDVLEIPVKKDPLYESDALEQLPEFPGGDEAMEIFLKNHLKFPGRAMDAGQGGKVVLEFVIGKDGKISNIDFLRKAGYGFDDEAKRVMQLMPDWKPGRVNGKPVDAKFQIPITFEFQQ